MTEKEDVIKNPEENTPLDDEALEKLAVEELMREAVQGAARAEIVGPSGWIKAPQQKTNKRFLVNTIRNAVSSNKYRGSRNSNSDKNNYNNYSGKRNSSYHPYRPSNQLPRCDKNTETTLNKDRPKKNY